MPPKRKAAAAKKGGKKAKVEEPASSAPATLKDAAEAMKAADKKEGGKKSHKVDSQCPYNSTASVVDDYDCMLNLTNIFRIGYNNNKYYIIQLIQQGPTYYTWNRWGRVGGTGANSLKAHGNLDAAVNDFEKKFRDKTSHHWAKRDAFVAKAGKYTLLEMADDNEPDAMPPKRKAAAAKKGGKKAKVEEPASSASATLKNAAEAMKAADKIEWEKKSHKVDSQCPYNSMSSVVDDYDCMLHQTNIGYNNNKYYVIQLILIKQYRTYYTWNRWGRVGESGSSTLTPHRNLDAAVKDFEKSFRDKTSNHWGKRDAFVAKAGKYTLFEMADDNEPDAPVVVVKAAASSDEKKEAKSKLDAPTQSLLKLIFDHDMFSDTMKAFGIDVKKMPLGTLSKGQIAKGFDVLDEIKKDMNAKKRTRLNELSSKFYTVIPHDFGEKIPPIINNFEALRAKMDMLLVLGDIEIAQGLQREMDNNTSEAKGDLFPNPLDVNYDMLKCDLVHVSPASEEFKLIQDYAKNTAIGRIGCKPKIQDVWKVQREEEGKRMKVHDKMGNRKLLWHGTKVAVVAATLKGGLRIMPHSGGPVGSGIYFASEFSVSAGYVGWIGKTGFMFLNEVVLGKEKQVPTYQRHLKSAPFGYDSVVLRGRTEPDPKQDTTITLGGKDVVVPQGKPISQKKWDKSHVSQSEYLIYRESQNQIRYLLRMEFVPS